MNCHTVKAFEPTASSLLPHC